MKKLLGIVLCAAIFVTGCSAASNDSAMAENAALTAADEDVKIIEDFAPAVYGLERKTAEEEAMDVVAGAPEVAVYDGKPNMSVPVETTAAAGDIDSPLIYTIFEQTSDTVAADDGSKLFLSQTYFPVVNTESDDLEAWLNDAVVKLDNEIFQIRLALQNQAAADYNTLSDGSTFYTYSYYSNMSTSRQDEVVISLLQLDSVYQGGAHPNHIQKAYNFDLEQQTQLALSDVLYPDSAQILLDQILDKLDNRLSTLESNGFYADYREVVTAYFEDSQLTPFWYFSDSGLVIYFNCYDIAPYAAGIIKVELLYDILEGVLLPQYFPAEHGTKQGQILLLSEAGERVVLTEDFAFAAEGAAIYLGAEGAVYDVRIYRLSSWLTEDTPIVGPMLFSANRLTDAEAVLLTESGQTGQPEYLLTYRTGDGTQFRLAVSSQQLESVDSVISD